MNRIIQQNSSVVQTDSMNKYIEDVFNSVIELYKTVAPEMISAALGIEEISSLKGQDVMKFLGLQIDYKAVDGEERIFYDDIEDRKKRVAEVIGQSQSQDRKTRLVMHLDELQHLEGIADASPIYEWQICRNI